MPHQKLIDALHDCPGKLVYAFAGAGSQALHWLHARPGSSRTVLEALDLYAAPSMDRFLGTTPFQYTSAATACAMAWAALVRARTLAPEEPVAGIGLTAAIATDQERRGEDRALVGVAQDHRVLVWNLPLEKGSREEGERLASELVLQALGETFRLPGAPWTEAAPEPAPFRGALLSLLGEQANLIGLPDLCFSPPPPPAVLSGSFDPLHDGHRKLAEIAGARLNSPVAFELSVVHPNKGRLDPTTVEQRMSQVFGPHPMLLSNSPLYLDKAHSMPGVVFVVGIDTAERIVDPQHYEGELTRALSEIRELGCRFLVAGRTDQQGFRAAGGLAVPEQFTDLFEPIPESAFRIDLSSTQLRAT